MKNIFKGIVIFLGIIVLLGIGGFVANGTGLITYKFFGPKWENARREVFENTNSFTKGKNQEATRLMFQYNQATDPVEKNAIKQTIALSFADFNEDKYTKSIELKAFIKRMKYGSPIPIPIKSK